MKNWMISTLLFLAFFFVDCKKENASKPDQILGTRFARFTHYVMEKAGSKDKKEQVALVYNFEEVNVLEEVEESGKKYYKVKTVEGKEGFAPSTSYAEGILVVTGNDLPVFRKPTITAGVEGEIGTASYCYLKEVQGEWMNADCHYLKLDKIKPESFHNVWIQGNDAKISRDPLLAQTAFEFRDAIQMYNKLSQSADPSKERKKITDKLNKIIERNDAFTPLVQATMDSMQLDEDTPAPPEEKPVEEKIQG